MLLPLKLVCDRCARKDGTNLISIQYCFQPDARTLLNTDIYIPARFWNKKPTRIIKEMTSNFGSAEVFNESLCLQMRIVEDLIILAKKKKIEDEIGFLKKTFHPKLDIASIVKSFTEADLLQEKKDQKMDFTSAENP